MATSKAVYAKRVKDGKVWTGDESLLKTRLKKKEFVLISKEEFDKGVKEAKSKK